MKRLIPFICLLLTGLAATFAQTGLQRNSHCWIKFTSSAQYDSASAMHEIRLTFGLGVDDALKAVHIYTDRLDMRHTRLKQFHLGIPVEGADLILHCKSGRPAIANGMLIGGITASPIPLITEADAIRIAGELIPAGVRAWEDPGMEALLRHATGEDNASFYPKPERVYVDPDFCENPSHYRLAYNMELYSLRPGDSRCVYIDAKTGELLLGLPLDLATDVPGQAVTKYSGLQNITSDSIAADTFRLRDASRGAGIETFNMHNTTNVNNATDFYDQDNYWNNFNSYQDEAATDAHWGMEMTYDYYLQKHNRNSYDDNGSKLIAHVHYDTLLVNAFWNGHWASFGDGNSNYSALTSVDVVAHELTHGVTSHSAGLIYLNESGAMNEAFSDIFGACVEYFAVPDSFDWYVGEDFELVNHTGFRNMADPNSKGDPDTYLGQHWYTGTMDNGGVHTNSGVMNYWFYLLASGGSGINDNGDAYNISALGMDTAAAIAYRNLTVYLTETSDYQDARMGAIQAAEDLYGPCSEAVLQTANAWYAVGLGEPISDYDIYLIDILSPKTSCGMGSSEQITVRFRYNGCGTPLTAGDSIPFAFVLDNLPTSRDTLTLSSQMNGGDTLTYTLDNLVDLSALGMHTIDCWVEMPGDTIRYNDTVKAYTFSNLLQQNFDLAVMDIPAPAHFCNLQSDELVAVEIGFMGCDSLPAGSQFNCSYRVNNSAVQTDSITLVNTLYAGEMINHIFNSTLDASAKGKYLIQAWTDYGPDTLRNNDTLTYLVTNPETLETDTITFEDSLLVQDTTIVLVRDYGHAFISQEAAHTGNFGFQLTGDNPDSLIPGYYLPDTADIWNVNPRFDEQLCFCVDATPWASARLRFDLRQTYAPTHKMVNVLLHTKRASSLRVLAEGVQMSKTYHPKTYITDTFVTRSVNLDAYAGTEFQLCFEARNYMAEAYDVVPWGLGDNAYLDNIRFEWTPLGKPETAIIIQINIHPNPATSTFTIEGSYTLPATLRLYDLTGRQVLNTALLANKQQVDIHNLSKGMYLLRLDNGAFTTTRKLLLQ